MRVAILLAAGASRRFGAANKLFARVEGVTLLDRALRLARQAPVQRLIVVTGHQSRRVVAAVRRRDRRAILVHAPDHGEGMGASLRAAARHIRPIDREAIVFLADMPWLPEYLAARLVAGVRQGDAIVRPVWRAVPGHPVLLRGEAMAMPARATGDQGLRSGHYPVRRVLSDRRCIADIDRPSALARRPPALL